jgi:hypothetical protein
MPKTPFDREPGAVDIALGKLLQRNYGQITRRSFLSGLTRRAISVAGIGLASQVLPFMVPEAEAQVPGGPTACGLHGYICSGSCFGGSSKLSWSACCQIPVSAPPCPQVWACCNYTDYCGTRPVGWPFGCQGPIGGTSWCGGGGDYICTTMSSGATYSSQPDCQNHCLGPSCAI